MKQPIVAAIALIAGLGIASPMLLAAGSDESAGNPAQAEPDRHEFGDMQRMMRGMVSGMQDGRERGPMQRPGGMREMMTHHAGKLPPKQRCEERLARRAGMIAYVVAKLNLTAEQRPLWDKLQTQLQSAADKQHQLCATLKPASERGQETILDRMARREQFLSARLQALQQARPALEQLYQGLSPEQKAIINHPFHNG